MKLRSIRRWLFATIICSLGGCVAVLAQDVDPTFKPRLAGVEFSSREVRPGDIFTMTIKFRNDGTKPARSDYWVFVHFEAPKAECTNIVIHADHAPSDPTSAWEPGQIMMDGPRALQASTDKPDQEYFVHIGVYDLAGTGERLLDTYEGGKIRVSSKAPASDTLAPPPLAADELPKRREALAGRLAEGGTVGLSAGNWSFRLDRATGAWELRDKRSGALWTSDPARARFGEAVLRRADRTVVWRLGRFDEVNETPEGLRLISRPTVDGKPTGVTLSFLLQPMSEPEGLRISYDTQGAGEWKVTRVRLLENALGVTEAEAGRLYVPERLGTELSASKGLPGSQEWLTYDSLSMEMCGAVKDGSALLVNWDKVDTRVTVNTSWPDLPLVPGRRMKTVTLDILGPQGMCSLHPLGKGGYVEIAHAYRPLAKAKGWLVTWAEKRKRFPTVDRILGAADFKPFVMSAVVPGSRFCTDGKEHRWVGFTFDEAAKCAEHWKNDLGIDRAFVVLAGWINGGYDVRHPDILPAAAELGGNAGLQDACERIRRCGYLVGLHDNYQDMYQNAPSWSLDWINKDAQGRPKMGGNWAGGQAWQVCAIKQVELAARKDTNLPKVAELFGPTVYFIDTVFAWGLVTCEDPKHPMTRQDDLEWKSKLCMLAKQNFGLFGSEEGREWAVPCADYLEGIFGHQTDSAPGTVIPLLPLVYHDCVQIMTHQGNRIAAGDEKKMADHVLFAEMQLPSFGNHLYWTQQATESRVPIVPLAAKVKDLGGRRFEITYRWKVEGQVPHDYWVFVHFLHKAATREESIAYQNDHATKMPTSQWKPGAVVEDGPYTVEVPAEFGGRARVVLGMTSDGGRVTLSNRKHDGLRYEVGTVDVTDMGTSFEPAEGQENVELWARGDGGWGEHLCVTDRVIKNAWEVLSPLNLLTAETPLTSHEFLTEDRLLQRTRFGDTTITVAYDKPAKIGDNAVPPYGFIIESPGFVAFCATRYNGVDYKTPTLFTARSLDGKPLAESTRVRVYHGFGDPRIRIAGKEFQVEREGIVGVR